MKLTIILSFVASVFAEGYLCNYPDIGATDTDNLVYDYYDLDGDIWVRSGETGFMSWSEYCRAKGDLTLHDDAGEAKCLDSRGLCDWQNDECVTIETRENDCLELCKAALAGEGPSCLGDGCPTRDSFYAICQTETEITWPVFTKEEVATRVTNETGIWVTFENNVYDISLLVDIHKGGSIILEAAGSDIGPFWAEYPFHDTYSTRGILYTYKIGVLGEEVTETPTVTTTTTSESTMTTELPATTETPVEVTTETPVSTAPVVTGVCKRRN